MKYAREIMELMSAYPKRDFRMKELIKSIVGNDPSPAQRHRARIQIANVIREHETIGWFFVVHFPLNEVDLLYIAGMAKPKRGSAPLD